MDIQRILHTTRNGSKKREKQSENGAKKLRYAHTSNMLNRR